MTPVKADQKTVDLTNGVCLILYLTVYTKYRREKGNNEVKHKKPFFNSVLELTRSRSSAE